METQTSRLGKIPRCPHRRTILLYLASKGEASVTELQRRIGLSQSYVSTELAKLSLSGLVCSSRRGAFRFYRLAEPSGEQTKQLLRACRALDDLEASSG